MNLVLLLSSIICGIVHYIHIQEVSALEWLGVLTSILNHAFTRQYLQMLDRFTMFICFLSSVNNPIILIATLLYLLSKITSVYFHVLAHLLVTYMNIKN